MGYVLLIITLIVMLDALMPKSKQRVPDNQTKKSKQVG